LKLIYYADQIVIDKNHRLWVPRRSGGIVSYSIHPENPSAFLEQEHQFESQTSSISARSVAIDTSNQLWVGTRYEGLYCFEIKDSSLILKHHFTVHDGLTDNFVFNLACDGNNNIWVGTQSGLDKISMENGQYQIEGTTRNNNIFQFIQTVVVTKDNQVWTLGNSGSILRISNNQLPIEYRPRLQISSIKTTDTVFDMPLSNLTLSHLENNLTFEVAAPSFIDEKQVKFSYILEGSANAIWSKPSSEATLNFINLPHGKYNLKLKAFFPLPAYGSQEMSYVFTITPPWWDTWWSKIVFAATIIGIIVLVIRNYYQRKLRKQKVLFEKQQAVEQERTRIAMEMHDDLGSGLTTIRYLAGGLSMQMGNSSKQNAEKIVSSAKSLVDNMNDIIWSMKSDNNTLNETLAYIRKQAAEQLETAGIDYHIEFPKDLPEVKLSNELKRNLLLISKEAIHNVVKHSAATSVLLAAEWESGQIQLKIIDNGKGIDLADISTFGNGVKSMRKRAEEIKALLEIMNAKGTTIVIKAPV
jgi:signal transduction histidine kinase